MTERNAHHIPQGDQWYKLQFPNLQKRNILKAKNPPFFHSLPLLYFWAWQYIVQHIPLASLGLLSKLGPYTASCPPPCPLAGQRGWKKASMLCRPGAVKTLLCYQHCFSHKSQALQLWWKLTPKPGMGMCSHWHCSNRGDQIPQREMSIKNALTMHFLMGCACNKHKIAPFCYVMRYLKSKKG